MSTHTFWNPVGSASEQIVLAQWVVKNDPAVLALVAEAEKLLPRIATPPAKYFRGYYAATPGDVDAQVHALFAHIHEKMAGRHQLNADTGPQLIPTIAEILAKRHPTSLDAALLLASCLEAIGID